MKKIIIMMIMLFSINNLIAQSGIMLGNYIGNIEINGKLTSVETKLTIQQNSVTGNYTYGNFSGSFKKSVLKNHVLTCEWFESENSKGTFKAIFNDNYSEFIAIWNYPNNKNGGSWTGKIN
jgi:hypothetical protein